MTGLCTLVCDVQVCAVRCVRSSDFMTADWFPLDHAVMGRIANRIINEVYNPNPRLLVFDLI